jgi:hypothetical protein
VKQRRSATAGLGIAVVAAVALALASVPFVSADDDEMIR